MTDRFAWPAPSCQLDRPAVQARPPLLWCQPAQAGGGPAPNHSSPRAKDASQARCVAAPARAGRAPGDFLLRTRSGRGSARYCSWPGESSRSQLLPRPHPGRSGCSNDSLLGAARYPPLPPAVLRDFPASRWASWVFPSLRPRLRAGHPAAAASRWCAGSMPLGWPLWRLWSFLDDSRCREALCHRAAQNPGTRPGDAAAGDWPGRSISPGLIATHEPVHAGEVTNAAASGHGPTPRTLGVRDVSGCYGFGVLFLSLGLFCDGGGTVRTWFLPACRGGPGARFHGPRPRVAGRSSFLAAVLPGPAYLVSGAKTVTRGFPVTVCLVAAVCRNFGRAFWARCA